jgi:hypothetical protein
MPATVVAIGLALSAQEQSPVLQGTWTGTSGAKKIYRGAWSATVVEGKPNAAHGSWVLVNDANKIVMQGTWAAEKSARGWQGTWSALVVPDRPPAKAPAGKAPAGKVYSGTWQAATKDSPAKALFEMLQQTLKEEISGSWRSGRNEGNWWLKGMTGG